MNLFTKQKQTHKLREGTYSYLGGFWGEGQTGNLGRHVCTATLKIENQQGPTYSTRNSAQYSEMT